MTDLKNIGLSEQTINNIRWVFSNHSNVREVVLYGSRAKGTYRAGSDIDLTVKGSLIGYSELLTLETELDDLMMPYMIDLSIFENIENSSLVEHIEQLGLLFYSAKK